ncbi:hypothetical protein PENTCL1PPCAC_11915, partial [Pristionchus entomophagus]
FYSLLFHRFSKASDRLAMHKAKDLVKPSYAQFASIGVTALLLILLIVVVAVDEFETGIGLTHMLGLSGFSNMPAWAMAAFFLLIAALLSQIAAITMHVLFFKRPHLKPKLFKGLIVINALTFLISATALGLWNSKGSAKGLASYSHSYNSLGACIFFEIVNFVLLILLKFTGGV